MAITQTITPLPPAPDSSMSEEDFEANAAEFTDALPPLVTEINAWGVQANATSVDLTNRHNDVVAKHQAVTTMTSQMQVSQTALNQAVASAQGSASSAASSKDAAAESASSAAASASQLSSYVPELPFYRVTPNVLLAGTTGSIPTGWSSGLGGAAYEKMFDVVSGTPWSSRSAEEQALLTAMGQSGAQYLSANFSVWKFSWNTSTTAVYGLLVKFTQAVGMTGMCMSRVLSGYYTNGIGMTAGITNQWRLTGAYYPPNPKDYLLCHMFVGGNYNGTTASSSGSILFAMPQLVAGRYPLELQKLGLIPYIGANSYE